jgi:dTDP-4-amino-4,6-dideoxygalactose transaminase
MHGQPADIDALLITAEEYDLDVIEDAAQAHLATYDDRPVGSFGDAGCFSFYPTKNMTVGGDGGMIVTNDDDVAATARTLRNHGRDDSGEHVELGLNYRLDETNAAFGDEQLSLLPDWIKSRRRAAEWYDDRLSGLEGIVTPARFNDSTHVYHHYPVQVADRPAFRQFLDDRGVSTGIHYERAVHEHPAVRERAMTPDLPVAEAYCARTVSLPMHPHLSEAEVDHVCNAVEAYVAEAASVEVKW